MTLESILVSDDTSNQTVLVVTKENDAESRKQQATIDFKMVTFSLSGKDYAIDIMYIKEIAKAGKFTYVPNVLPFVVGVYNLRGEIIPILDMRLFFNIEVTEKSATGLENLLILTVGEQTFGIVVDKIDKVVGVQKSTIQPPHPLFSDVNVKYISGVVESNRHLYILLDIERIFSKETIETSQIAPVRKAVKQSVSSAPVKSSSKESESVKVKNEAASVKTLTTDSSSVEKLVQKDDPQTEELKKKNDADDVNLKFIAEGLKNYANFNVSSVNENWIKSHYDEWKKQKGNENVQLKSQNDAELYLKTFWSNATDSWWSKEYADEVFNLLPENSAKQIIVWNPGCGKGSETYCLACVLSKKYPNSKVRLYAQDIDLLNVSNAPTMTVPANVASGWLSPFLTKNASGKDTFSKEIKDSILFEYHDCLHTNALPMTDIIFARDLLSFIDPLMIKNVVTDFDEKLKGNGILVIGENEDVSDFSDFIEYTVGTLTAYKKQ